MCVLFVKMFLTFEGMLNVGKTWNGLTGKIAIVINHKLDILIHVIYKSNLHGYCHYSQFIFYIFIYLEMNDFWVGPRG